MKRESKELSKRSKKWYEETTPSNSLSAHAVAELEKRIRTETDLDLIERLQEMKRQLRYLLLPFDAMLHEYDWIKAFDADSKWRKW